MTREHAAPPLPEPQPPAAAARAMSQAAQAAASAWAEPMDPAGYNRAVRQLYSFLRDLGIATRGLARYQTRGDPGILPAIPDFPQRVAAASRSVLEASRSLDGVLAAEGLGLLDDDDEPGTALCQAGRQAIRAWRQPAGTRACRDATIEQLMAAIGVLAQAAGSLAGRAQHPRAGQLHAIDDRLGDANRCLAGTLQAQVQPGPQGGPE